MRTAIRRPNLDEALYRAEMRARINERRLAAGKSLLRKERDR